MAGSVRVWIFNASFCHGIGGTDWPGADPKTHSENPPLSGPIVGVKLIGIDDRGKVRLSMKVVDQATGKEIASDKKDEGAASKEHQPAH